jgi:hypothetical protein
MAAVLSLHVDTFMVITKERSHVWDIHVMWSMERKVRQIETANEIEIAVEESNVCCVCTAELCEQKWGMGVVWAW